MTGRHRRPRPQLHPRAEGERGPSGVEHDTDSEAVTELFAEKFQVPEVARVRRTGRLHLDTRHQPVEVRKVVQLLRVSCHDALVVVVEPSIPSRADLVIGSG